MVLRPGQLGPAPAARGLGMLLALWCLAWPWGPLGCHRVPGGELKPTGCSVQPPLLPGTGRQQAQMVST